MLSAAMVSKLLIQSFGSDVNSLIVGETGILHCVEQIQRVLHIKHIATIGITCWTLQVSVPKHVIVFRIFESRLSLGGYIYRLWSLAYKEARCGIACVCV